MSRHEEQVPGPLCHPDESYPGVDSGQDISGKFTGVAAPAPEAATASWEGHNGSSPPDAGPIGRYR